MVALAKRLWARVSRRRRAGRAFYPDDDPSAELERQIEIVDPARHLGEEYPSIDVLRRYGRT